MRNACVPALAALLVLPAPAPGNPDTGTLGATGSGSVLGQSRARKVRPRRVDQSLPDHQYRFVEETARPIAPPSAFDPVLDTWQYHNPDNVPSFVVYNGTCFGLTKATAEWYKQIVYPVRVEGKTLESPLEVQGTVNTANLDARYRVRPYTAQIDDEAVHFMRLATFYQDTIGGVVTPVKFAQVLNLTAGRLMDWNVRLFNLGQHRWNQPGLLPEMGQRDVSARELVEEFLLPAVRDPSLAVADVSITYANKAAGTKLRHAMLVTRIVAGEAEAVQERGRTQEGTSFAHRVPVLKLELYDSNFPYRDRVHYESEGRRERYLLYFPSVGRLGFPRGHSLRVYNRFIGSKDTRFHGPKETWPEGVTRDTLQGGGPYIPERCPQGAPPEEQGGCLVSYNIHGVQEWAMTSFQQSWDQFWQDDAYAHTDTQYKNLLRILATEKGLTGVR